MRNRSGRRGSPTRARAGRPLGATSWSRNLANVAAHHAKVLLELWLAEVPVLVQVLFRQLPHSPEPAFKHVREMARSYTEEAVLTIVDIMRTSEDAHGCAWTVPRPSSTGLLANRVRVRWSSRKISLPRSMRRWLISRPS